jgi:type I restriction enzyme S subunit
MKNWVTKKLDEVCDLITCGVAAKPDYVDDGIPFLSAKNVKEGQIIWSGYNCISEKTHKELTKNNKPLLGDILYTRVGSYGEAAVIEDDNEFSVFVSLTLIKVDKTVLNNYFLKHYLNSDFVKRLAKKSISSSGVGNLNVGTVREFPILVPPLPEQQRIVAILDEAFAAIAKAKANAEQNLKNAKELFESYLQGIFENKGDGWEEKMLGEVYDVRDGTHDSPKYQEEGFPLITSKNLKKDLLNYDNVNYISEQDYININKRSKVDKGDILFAMIGTIGNPVVIQDEPDFAIKNVALFKVPKGQNSNFLKYYLDAKSTIDKMMGDAKGTTQKFVGLGYLRSFEILLPPLKEQQTFVQKLDALSAETKKLEAIYQQKINDLEELKKSVLQKAFSGELTSTSSVTKEIAVKV